MAANEDAPAGRPLLPVLGQPVERADAARNRRALLAAGHRFVERNGVNALTMERVAAEARVGVGTVYRRFGDRGGLAFALLDDEERHFQAAFLTGPSPLGPGAPPVPRIRAFLHAYLDRLESQGELYALAETKDPTARFTSGAYRTARTHLAALITHVLPDGDPAYVADALLALTDAGLFLHQRRALGYSVNRIKAGVDRLVASLLPANGT